MIIFTRIIYYVNRWQDFPKLALKTQLIGLEQFTERLQLKLSKSSSPGLPQEDGDSSDEKVDNMLAFETDVGSELFADNALPVGVEVLVEVTFQLECYFGHLLLLIQSCLGELNSLEFQI